MLVPRARYVHGGLEHVHEQIADRYRDRDIGRLQKTT